MSELAPASLRPDWWCEIARGLKTITLFFPIMKLTSLAIACLAFTPCGMAAPAQENSPIMKQNTHRIALAVHGGAGTIERSKMTSEREREYRAGIENALRTGREILDRGGSSLDAVEAAVRVMEDDPNFNAGKGSVFTSAGTNEMDAAIMDGKTLSAGAVACVEHVRNPIVLARAVMEKSKHVMMAGQGAEEFAKRNGIELVDAKYFFTQRRWDDLQKIKASEKSGGGGGKKFIISGVEPHGTVGAVALDSRGNLAAATSTGGTDNKLPGRVGDSAVIGAGTYANNATCAVSCTGDGEFFIRAAVAHQVVTLMELHGMSLAEAAERGLADSQKLGGTGGLIAVDKNGSVALPFNTSGMYRGYLGDDGKFVIDIYK
jgi:L-asparaginase / beta-aspartyl-peptidase